MTNIKAYQIIVSKVLLTFSFQPDPRSLIEECLIGYKCSILEIYYHYHLHGALYSWLVRTDS